jgi:serine/threonine protein kinase
MNPGDVIAERFVLERVAGEGGFGVVWRALDRRTGEPVALKMLRQRVTRPEAERLVREGRMLLGLRHPGIVRCVMQSATPEGVPFLAMEWVEGEDLAARLRRASLNAPETLALLRPVADVLAAVHREGIVHRDVKPRNLALPGGELGRVKLLDFGIARWDEVMYAMTSTGAVVGSLGYMAPEQARGVRDLDARVDVFALGCVAFECLCGRTPFAGDENTTLARLATEDAPRVKTLRADVPDVLDALIASMLAREPSRRPADGTALRQAIDAVVARRT